jgi:hypothetical protein
MQTFEFQIPVELLSCSETVISKTSAVMYPLCGEATKHVSHHEPTGKCPGEVHHCNVIEKREPISALLPSHCKPT